MNDGNEPVNDSESCEIKSDCQSCNYKKYNPESDDGFCYMFQDPPTSICLRHSKLNRDDKQLATSLALMCLTI